MSEHRPAGDQQHTPAASGSHDHASLGTYLKVTAILCLVTALEFAVIYLRQLTPILTPLLIVMSVGKFALVVMFFMHLRYDGKSLTFLFVAPLLLAAGLTIALMTLPGDFLLFKR